MFRQWCTQQGFSNSNNLSHVLMDGGVLSVPFDRLGEFYAKYVEAVNDGEHIFVVEQKTDIFNFFVDFDYKSSVALSVERIEYIARRVCDRVATLGGKSCLVSVAQPKSVSNAKIKTGIHMNWPDFTVNQEGAVRLRQHIIAFLATREAENWEEIVDKSVYGNPVTGSKGSGFRLPWSHKKGRHVECKGQGCADCDHSGKITEGMYLPIFMYRHGTPFSLLTRIDQQPTVELLMSATVRSQSTFSHLIQECEKGKVEGSFTKAQTKHEFENPEAAAHLETFIRKYLEGQENARITKMFKHGGCYLVSTDSSFCENLGRMHNSNHVWFYVSEKDGGTVCQKCFCRCETLVGRKQFCKDFYGRRHILPPSVSNLLFPNKKSDTIRVAIRSNVSATNFNVGSFCRFIVPETK